MNDKFVFFSGSSDKKPGFGTGESKNKDDNYSDLEKIKDWRKKLSNFYISKFIIDDNEWNSVEHFFHALKFRNNKISSKNYNFYKTFVLNSGSPWCEDPLKAKQAGKAGRVSAITGKVFDKKLGDFKIPKDVKMRDDFYSNNIPSKLQKIAFLAKFTQNPDLKKVLLSTKDAELWHYTGTRGGGKGNILMQDLMIVRECIRKYDDICDLSKISQFSTENVTKIIN